MNTDIFKRADLRQISSFILFGEETEIKTGSYAKQIEEARNLAYEILEKLSEGEINISTAKLELSDVFDIYEEICTEIGMKLGAKLLNQLLDNEK